MYLPALLGLGGGEVIDRLAEKIEYSSERFLSYRNGNGLAGIDGFRASYKTVGAAHSDAAHDIVADMLCDLDHKALSVIVDLDSVLQIWERVRRKANIEYRAYDLNDRTYIFLSHLP